MTSHVWYYFRKCKKMTREMRKLTGEYALQEKLKVTQSAIPDLSYHSQISPVSMLSCS